MRYDRVRYAMLVTIAALLAFNGAATIYAAASSPTIRACVKSSGPQKGLMRYAGTSACAAGETALTWTAGDAAGARYWVTQNTETLTSKGYVPGAVPPLALPAGSYRLELSAWLNGTNVADRLTFDFTCAYRYNDADAGTRTVGFPTTFGGGLYDERFVKFTEPTTVTIVCNYGSSGRGYKGFAGAILSATPITIQQ